MHAQSDGLLSEANVAQLCGGAKSEITKSHPPSATPAESSRCFTPFIAPFHRVEAPLRQVVCRRDRRGLGNGPKRKQ